MDEIKYYSILFHSILAEFELFKNIFTFQIFQEKFHIGPQPPQTKECLCATILILMFCAVLFQTSLSNECQ